MKILGITPPTWAARTKILEVLTQTNNKKQWEPPTEEHIKTLLDQAQQELQEAENHTKAAAAIQTDNIYKYDHEKAAKKHTKKAKRHQQEATIIKNYLTNPPAIPTKTMLNTKLKLTPTTEKPDYSEEDAKRLVVVHIDTKGLYT